MTSLLGAIAWDPEIRNILALLVGIVVLCGSVYLIVATNTGIRTGMLLALAGLFGWLTIMGIVWWIYGIGMHGRSPEWKVEEINYASTDLAALSETTVEEARELRVLGELPTAQDILDERPELVDEILPPGLAPDVRAGRAANINLGQIVEVDPSVLEDYGFEEALGDWNLLPQSDRQRGDAVATADAFLGPDGRGLFDGPSDYVVRDAFDIGGKEGLPDDPSRWDRIAKWFRSTFVELTHPTHYAVVQVQGVVPICEPDQESTADARCIEVAQGEAPPPPEIDEDQPIVSVVMVRDLGDRRFPAAMVTLVFGLLFALTCWSLHRRDEVIARARAAAA